MQNVRATIKVQFGIDVRVKNAKSPKTKFKVCHVVYYDQGKKRKYFSTGYKLTRAEWETVNNRWANPPAKFQEMVENCLEQKNKIFSILDTMKHWDLDTFTKRWTGRSLETVWDVYDAIHNEKLEAERFGSAWNFKSSKEVLMWYMKDKANTPAKTDVTPAWKCKESTPPNLYFHQIDVAWLEAFEEWFFNEKGGGVSQSHFTGQCRNLRTAFRWAMTENIVGIEYYPFHRLDNAKGFKIPATEKKRNALSIDELAKITQCKDVTPDEAFTRDMFAFSFLAGGINLADICYMKWDNIHGDRVHFVRKKTKHTRRKTNRELSFKLDPLMLEIIKEWGTNPMENEFLFPVLNNSMSEARKYRVQRTAQTVWSRRLKRIAAKVGVKEISFNMARHGFASWAHFEKGMTVAEVSDALGHQDVSTTLHYLKKFSNVTSAELVSEAASKLLG